MITQDALKAHTETVTATMSMEAATPEQEVAREIDVLLGHGASVQAIMDELTKSMNREEDKQRHAAYKQAVQFILTGAKYLLINEHYRIEVMPSCNHYPMRKHTDGQFYYFRQGRNGQTHFKTERGARKFITDYMTRMGEPVA